MSIRSSNVGNLRKRFLQLHPVNASSGGVYSFKNGLPLIKFDISSSNAPLLMDGGALRISGRFTARQGAAGTTELTAGDTNFLDGFTGFNQCIETITISSKRLNSVLERCTNYNRLVPSITSGRMSSKEYETKLSHYANQHGTTPLTRPTLNTYQGFNTNGVVPAASQRGCDFSTPLYCGILNSGEDIDLSSSTGQGGMVIEILLRSDSGVVFGTSASANQATYNLSDLVLTVPVYEMTGAPNMPAGGVSQFNFNTWSSMFQTVNSSSGVVAMTPGLSRVAASLTSFITASDLGNQNFNSCRLGGVGEIQQLRYSRNGALYPLQYRLQTVSQQNNNVAKSVASNLFSNHTYSVNADIVRNYLEGILTDRYNKVKNCMLAYNNWSAGAVDKSQNSGRDGTTPGTAMGCAILYDAYGSGTNFQQTVFSFELQTSATNQLRISNGVNVANSIDGTSATAQAATLYFLNKNTLMLSPQGIDVQR